MEQPFCTDASCARHLLWSRATALPSNRRWSASSPSAGKSSRWNTPAPAAPSSVRREPDASQPIDQCGLRGLTVGGAQVSKKHAGFVVNIGGATCADVLGLVEQVKDCVKEKTGFVLEMEVRQLP